MTLREQLDAILERQDLSAAQASALLVALTQPDVPPAQAGALLAGLRCNS